MKQNEPNKVIYIRSTKSDKAHILNSVGKIWCGVKLGGHIKLAEADKNSICQNCLDRMEGKGVGRTAIK